MADDVVTLITADHRKAEELLAKLAAGDGDRRATVAKLGALLTAHARAEDDLDHPGLDGQPFLEEHKETESLLNALKRADPDSAEFADVQSRLTTSVSHHVQEEESTLLPLLARTVDKGKLTRLGKAFKQRRDRELRALTAAKGGRATRRGAGGDLTKRELYERARTADIPGRSRMTKRELEKALAKAGS